MWSYFASSLFLLLTSMAIYIDMIAHATYCSPSHTVLDWQTFLGTSGAGRTYEAWANVNASFNPSTLSVDVSVTVPYIVRSNLNGRTRPVAFVLDFEPFPEYSRSISQINNCANRESASYMGKSFQNWWTYTDLPWLPGNVGNAATNMLFGPSGVWSMTVSTPNNAHSVNTTCDPVTVTYSNSFSLTQLEACTKAGGARAFGWVDTNEELYLSGTFDVTVVSPRENNQDLIYNSVSLGHIPMRASFRKPAHLVSNANVRNFGIEIQAVRFDGANPSVVRLTFVTWSPRTVRFNLTGATLFSPNLVGRTNVHGVIRVVESPYLHAGDCMATTTFRCLQLTVVTVNVSDTCPPGSTINLTGLYGLQADMHCGSPALSSTERAECAQYVAANPNGALTQEIGWTLGCDRVDYSGLLTGTITFYQNADFAVAYATPPTYVVEVDTAYVEISLTGANPVSLEILQVQLVSVYLCTLKPGFDMSGMNGATGDGGCIQNPNVDNSPNDPFYILFLNGQVNNGLNFDVAQIPSGSASSVRFSFTVPTMLRSEFYVHAKVQVTLLNGTNPIRRLFDSVFQPDERRRLQSSSSTNALKNSQTRVSTTTQSPSPTPGTTDDVLVIVIFVLSGLILCCGLIVAIWFIKKKLEGRKLEEETLVTGNTISGLQVRVSSQPNQNQAVRIDTAKTPLTASPEKDESEYDGAHTFGISSGRRSMTREV